MQGHAPARQGRVSAMYTVEQIIAEMRREIAVRFEVYPRLVASGRLPQKTADARIAKLEEGVRLLQQYVSAQQGELFQ